MKYFAGVEGGATASSLVLLNDSGETLAKVSGPSTNPLLVGEEECFARIKCMINEAKSASNLPEELTLDALGLCLSGCSAEDECAQLGDRFQKRHPDISRKCAVANDIIGSVFTSNLKAGIILISGTGSNSVLFDSDEIVSSCGGWGHLFGDEGSAFWIAWRAYKTLLDDNDNYIQSTYDTKRLRQVICSHFNLKSEHHVGSFYQLNDKKRFASLSKELYKSTKSERDEAIDDIFRQAGCLLARNIVAHLPKADKAVVAAGLNIVCVGAVFGSWDLLEPGFVDVLSQHLKNFRLLRLKQSSAVGAAKFAAKCVGVLDLPIGQTTELLYAYSGTSHGYHANGHHFSLNGHANGIGNANPQANGNGATNGNGLYQGGKQINGPISPERCSII